MGEKNPHRSWHRNATSVSLAAFCIDKYEYPNQKGQKPRSSVTWEQALQACQSHGKTLCKSAQWERACKGEEGRRYSYGNRYDLQRCNTPIQGGGPGNAPAPLKPSGYFPNCSSPEGVFDLNGNVSEWVLDPWDGAPEPFNKRAKVDPETWREIRGGTMWSNTFYGQDCSSSHGHPKTRWRNIDDGFRCCREPMSSSEI